MVQKYKYKYNGEIPTKDERIVTVIGGENRIEPFCYYSVNDIPLIKESILEAVEKQEEYQKNAQCEHVAKRSRIDIKNPKSASAKSSDISQKQQSAFMDKWVMKKSDSDSVSSGSSSP
jgi:hypothetical protein